MTPYEEMWTVLNKHYFNVDIDKKYSDLKCCICKNLIRNACQSPCGCRYCYVCIARYLHENDRCCPSQNDDCKDRIINLIRDITIDHAANRKISMIEVKCSHEMCNKMIELRQMAKHLKSHEVTCPYLDIGCKLQLPGLYALIDHMCTDNQSHDSLLIQYLDNIKNDMNDLKENYSTYIEPLHKIIKRNQYLMQYTLLNRRCEKMPRKDFDIHRLESKIKDIFNNWEREHRLLKLEMEGLSNELVAYKIEKDLDMSTSDSTFTSDLSLLSYSMSEDSFTNSPLIIKEIKEYIAPFEWKINDFTVKQTKAMMGENLSLYSEPFYSHKNGYKMRLRVDPNGVESVEHSYLSVSFCVIDGEYDDILDWPMTKQVKISLMNQKTGMIYTSKRYKFDSVLKKSKCIFHKPSSRFEDDEDYCFGTLKFIKLNVLVNNEKIFLNNSIVLKCFVS